MAGFRSLGETEEVEFLSEETPKGPEAVKVRSPNGGQIKGSDRRPAPKKKAKKIRLVHLELEPGSLMVPRIKSNCKKP